MTARRWTDPFDEMSDEEFDTHIDTLFSARPKTVGVSLRIPRDLLERVKREAGRAGVPYQTFMKGILDAAVSRLERRVTRSRRPGAKGSRPSKPQAGARRGAA